MSKSSLSSSKLKQACPSRNFVVAAASVSPLSTSGEPSSAVWRLHASRLRDLESENTKLKKLLAEAHLDIHALKSVFGVKR
jgi:putative transposase